MNYIFYTVIDKLSSNTCITCTQYIFIWQPSDNTSFHVLVSYWCYEDTNFCLRWLDITEGKLAEYHRKSTKCTMMKNCPWLKKMPDLFILYFVFNFINPDSWILLLQTMCCAEGILHHFSLHLGERTSWHIEYMCCRHARRGQVFCK